MDECKLLRGGVGGHGRVVHSAGTRSGRGAADQGRGVVENEHSTDVIFAVFQGTSNGGQRTSNRKARVNRRADLPYNGTIWRFDSLLLKNGDRHLRYPGKLQSSPWPPYSVSPTCSATHSSISCCIAAQRQGFTLIHLFAQRKHFLWDTLVGFWLSMTKTAQVQPKSGRM